jgi:predicted RNA-binding protein
MCEFTVYEESNLGEKIADDIVRARTKSGNLVINKVLGESMTLQNTMILEVNVSKEQMLISQSPLVGNLTALVESISEFRKHPSPKLYDEIAKAWDQAKTQGDTLVKSLKTKK